MIALDALFPALTTFQPRHLFGFAMQFRRRHPPEKSLACDGSSRKQKAATGRPTVTEPFRGRRLTVAVLAGHPVCQI